MWRLDDLATGRHLALSQQVAAGVAMHPHEVATALAAAEEQATRHGRWVGVAVAYEAAPAFDRAMLAKAAPAGVPLVHWIAFERCTPTPPVRAGAPMTRQVVRHQAIGGYRHAVDMVRARIATGDVYQVNLTDRLRVAEVDPASVYASMLAGQSCAYGALLDLGDVTVACASPELFFRWDGDTITCRPMKGTRARHPRADIDSARATDLATSAKDRAENVMIVDLLRNDLARVARLGTVRVPDLFTVERYETVWQMTSTVQADVDPDTSLADVFTALFPCGSVTGAPKIAAMAIIDELEPDPRGIYCGAVGYLAPPGHGPRAVFCVPIRTAVIDRDGTLTYGAGAGITWSSDPVEEDAEVVAKARVLTHPWTEFELLETLRLDDGGLVHLHRHLDRLTESAAWFGIPFDRDAAVGAVAAVAPAGQPQRLRLLVARDGTIRVECHPLDPAPDVARLAVDTEVTRSDDVFSCHKTTARAHYVAARSRHPDADDVVLVNELGHAVETTVANLAYRLGDRWYVPPLTDGGLAGVGRAVAVDEGRVTERSIAAADLGRCDELAVVNDLRGWRPAALG